MVTSSKPKNTKPTPTPESTQKRINKKDFISSVIKRKTLILIFFNYYKVLINFKFILWR